MWEVGSTGLAKAATEQMQTLQAAWESSSRRLVALRFSAVARVTCTVLQYPTLGKGDLKNQECSPAHAQISAWGLI